jgi:hypothetical protein
LQTLYIEVLKKMDMAQTKFGSCGFCHFSMEIIGLVNNGKSKMFSVDDINVDHEIEYVTIYNMEQ